MQFDWSTLGAKPPTALVRARNLSHHALQWVAKAARANLEARPDDAHVSLSWDSGRAAFLSQPMPVGSAEVRVGFSLRRFALVLLRNNRDLDEFELGGRKDASVAVWFDSAMRTLGLKTASEVDQPYSLPSLPVTRGSAYHVSGETDAFGELARWFDMGADLLADVIAANPAAGPVRCGPQRFNMSAVIAVDAGGTEPARSISVGLSPGDEHYAQPYVYVCPAPRLKPADLPLIAAPGQWHLKDFVAAVATGEDILLHPEPAATVAAFVNTAIDIGRERLGNL